MADRLEQAPRRVEVDRIALVEIALGFARDHRRQKEHDIRALGDQPLRRPFGAEVKRLALRREGGGQGRRSDQIDEMGAFDWASAQRAVTRQRRAELPADHSGRADNENPQCFNSLETGGDFREEIKSNLRPPCLCRIAGP